MTFSRWSLRHQEVAQFDPSASPLSAASTISAPARTATPPLPEANKSTHETTSKSWPRPTQPQFPFPAYRPSLRQTMGRRPRTHPTPGGQTPNLWTTSSNFGGKATPDELTQLSTSSQSAPVSPDFITTSDNRLSRRRGFGRRSGGDTSEC